MKHVYGWGALVAGAMLLALPFSAAEALPAAKMTGVDGGSAVVLARKGGGGVAIPGGGRIGGGGGGARVAIPGGGSVRSFAPRSSGVLRHSGGVRHFKGGGGGYKHHGRRHYSRGLWIAPIITYGYYASDECAWLKRRAIATGSRYWWNRYYECRDW